MRARRRPSIAVWSSVLAALLAACGGSPPAASQGPATITFDVSVPTGTPVDARVFVVGNQPALGEWVMPGLELSRDGSGHFVARVTFQRGTRLEFRVSRGGWDTMELGPGGEDLAPHTHTVAGDARITVPVARWREPIPCQPTLTGNVHKHAQVGAGTATPVPPRDVIVYLPPGYDADAPRRYPVLYMHDGNNVMDSCTAFAGEWGADETAEELVTAGQIEPLIIVGVYNTSDRVAEYTPVADPQYGGGRADDYGRYLVEVVKPLVDSTYRTRPEPQYTGVAGSSLGGLVSMYFGLTRSSTFSRIGVLSPSVWWANREIVTRVNALAARTPVRIWEDIGTAEVSDPGGAAQTVADARALRDALLAKGWVLDADLKYLEVQGAMHNESAWRARFGDVLKFLYPP